MEEMLGNMAGARQIFERWMQWNPDAAAWNSYIKFEIRLVAVPFGFCYTMTNFLVTRACTYRHKNHEGARQIYERWLVVHNEATTYLKYAKFEEKHGRKDKARVVFERATKELADDITEDVFIAFAQFEEREREVTPHCCPFICGNFFYRLSTWFFRRSTNVPALSTVTLLITCPSTRSQSSTIRMCNLRSNTETVKVLSRLY